MKSNILFIGMPGVGKTFNSRVVSEKTGYEYISVDDLITAGALEMGISNKRLMKDEDFVALENRMLLSISNKLECIIDTGASAIYSTEAMNILRRTSFVVYLFDDISKINERFEKRGKIHLIGMQTEDTPFEEIFNKREKLYEDYADCKIDVSEHKDDLVNVILSKYYGS